MEKQDDPLQQQISLQNMFDAIKVIKKKHLSSLSQTFSNFKRLLKCMNPLKI